MTSVALLAATSMKAPSPVVLAGTSAAQACMAACIPPAAVASPPIPGPSTLTGRGCLVAIFGVLDPSSRWPSPSGTSQIQRNGIARAMGLRTY
ncbi:hypothetical protein [Mycolicibacterium hodleri]|uniref:Secreted protein n=1 Tax=Mycolicibacterium hodleri TaxID=49897 RepID=A0A502EGK9_9MYCO|nr:hypothetical protein [Mycolicibacterium hodleri]TPG36587.1 hypothetical protein EAH80_01070 [Mycolicibacterium hodleri]